MSEIILTRSTEKQISMIGKINEPFSAYQICLKKGIKNETKDRLEKELKEANAKLIFITREYDGAERYWLCYKTTDTPKFTEDKDIIVL